MPSPQDLRSQGTQHYRAGRFAEAQAAFAQAQQAFSDAVDWKGAAESANDRGVAARKAGRLDEAGAAFGEAFDLFENVGDRRGQGMVAGNQGALAETRGRRDEAAAQYKRAIALLDESGAAGPAGELYLALSRLRFRQGRWLAALGAYDAGLDRLKHLTLTQHLLRFLLKLMHRMGA